MLGDRALERLGDVLQPVLQDVAEADQRRQADAAPLQVVDQLLADRSARVGSFVRTDHQMAVLTDREISVSPA